MIGHWGWGGQQLRQRMARCSSIGRLPALVTRRASGWGVSPHSLSGRPRPRYEGFASEVGETQAKSALLMLDLGEAE
eukprot:scaffold293861_cov28-Tisochrysis_lutea.AAC.9